MKAFKIVLGTLLLLLAIFMFGPKANFGEIVSPEVIPWSITLDSVDNYVKTRDLGIPDLKPDNQSRIVWADSLRKTRYSIVYLHGFSASPMESEPTHFDVAKRLGYNIYLPLLSGHGRLDKESFLELTPNDLIKSAKEAVAIGQLIGEDVILMSCSTGGTLSIYLAGANPEMIDALIMYSPNIKLADPTAPLITSHWGEKIIKAILGDYWDSSNRSDEYGWKYWTIQYRTEGLIALQALLDDTMTPEVFQKVTQPYFIGVYYKDEEHQDPTISVDAVRAFHKQTNTPDAQKRFVAFPEAGEHVLTNPHKAKNVEAVVEATLKFTNSVLNSSPEGDE